MDILEPFIKNLFRDAFVMHLQQGRQDLLCHLTVIDLLPVQHQDVRNIHKDIRVRDMTVSIHR